MFAQLWVSFARPSSVFAWALRSSFHGTNYRRMHVHEHPGHRLSRPRFSVRLSSIPSDSAKASQACRIELPPLLLLPRLALHVRHAFAMKGVVVVVVVVRRYFQTLETLASFAMDRPQQSCHLRCNVPGMCTIRFTGTFRC